MLRSPRHISLSTGNFRKSVLCSITRYAHIMSVMLNTLHNVISTSHNTSLSKSVRMDKPKNKSGRFITNEQRRRNKHSNNIIKIDHNYYASGHLCDETSCNLPSCVQREKLLRRVDRTGWRNGVCRHVIEWGVLLEKSETLSFMQTGTRPTDSI